MAHDSDSTDPTRTNVNPTPQPIRSSWNENDSPSLEVIELIANATGREPAALPPLYESVDTDALDALVAESGDLNGDARITFTHAGVEVTIYSDGQLEARTDGAMGHATRDGPRTASELNAQLKRLLGEAARNGISVSGGWAVRNGSELPDWDVHVTRVTKPDDPAETEPSGD